jgi:UDP-N-acetylglucosamine acyltransferase
MATLLIHPTAVITSGAELHPTVQVGAYAVIGPKVKVGAGTVIGPHVVLDGDTHIGERNQLFPGAAIGLEPQDLKYDGSMGPVRIGNSNQIREYVTIHRPTRGDEITLVGNNNMIMAYTHVGHNCVIEVHVESGARISGVLGVHQFVRIGRLSMVGGMTRIDRDVPPFMMVEGNPPRVRSLNTVGLQRAGLDLTDLQALKLAFKLLYRSEMTFAEAMEKLDRSYDNNYVQHLSHFIRRSQLPGRRGLISGRG